VTRLREDDQLRDLFLELRSETERPGRLPDFDAMLSQARARAVAASAFDVQDGGLAPLRPVWPSRRMVRAGAWATAVLAAAIAGLIVVQRRPSGDSDFERLVASYTGDTWASPTSGLLDVPGIELTRSLPAIGGPARGLDPTTRPEVLTNGSREDL
jgi:hypothetical protein